MARGLTDEPTNDSVDSKQLEDIASMLFALLRTVQEINAKLPPLPEPKETPLNGL